MDLSLNNTQFVTASQDKTAILWDLISGQKLVNYKGHTEGVACIAISKDSSKIVTGSFDKTAIIWDYNTGQLLFTLLGHTDTINSIALSNDQMLLPRNASGHVGRYQGTTVPPDKLRQKYMV